jgi:hypothetical protein
LVAMFVGRMEPNEEALVWVHFCQAVSEEKIFLNSSQSETRIALGGHICWCEVNLITRLGVIALFSSFFSSPDPKGHVRYCHHLASVVRPLTFSYLAVGHNFKRDTPRDHLCQVWLHLAKLFQRRRFF